MQLQTKALYNLLRLGREQDASLSCEPWQIEDLRKVSLDALFKRLAREGLSLNAESFHRFAEESNSPEELADILLVECEEPQLHDKLYLVLFELWRRLLPERQTLSIFCDELDHQIALYDAGRLKSDEAIQDALANLIDIFEENADAGAQPTEILESVSRYCAHDLTSFWIDYITDLLDEGNKLYASELIEHFAPYAPEKMWFEFFCVRLVAFDDPVEANRLLASLLRQKEMAALDLLLEAMRFIAIYGEKPLFMEVARQITPLLETREEFEELLQLAAEYFQRRDHDELEQAVSKILEGKRSFGPKEVERFASILRSLEN